MDLQDALALSQRAVTYAEAPSAQALRSRAPASAFALGANFDDRMVDGDRLVSAPPNAAFGAARSGRKWRVAIRAWTKADLKHPATQWLISQAQGEVDIRITGVIRARAAKKRGINSAIARYRSVCRPLLAGHSVAHSKVTAGTLGAWVHRGDGQPLILSNNHVLANSNAAKLGDSIVQPGPSDDPAKRGGVVGALDGFVYLRKTRNQVDAALASVQDRFAPDDLSIPQIGRVPGYYSGPIGEVAGLSVQKTGRTTGHTRGRVTTITVNLPVDYGDPGRPRIVRFEQALEISSGNKPFSDGGDSGSLITDGDGWAVGLLFAGDAEATFANHIPGVLDALKVDFLQ
jgi:hypothetical protein